MFTFLYIYSRILDWDADFVLMLVLTVELFVVLLVINEKEVSGR